MNMKSSFLAAGLAAFADSMNNIGTLGGKIGQPFGRMPQADFENAVRAKAKHQIEVANRKRAERAESPKEKKLKKKAPQFQVRYRRNQKPVFAK